MQAPVSNARGVGLTARKKQKLGRILEQVHNDLKEGKDKSEKYYIKINIIASCNKKSLNIAMFVCKNNLCSTNLYAKKGLGTLQGRGKGNDRGWRSDDGGAGGVTREGLEGDKSGA